MNRVELISINDINIPPSLLQFSAFLVPLELTPPSLPTGNISSVITGMRQVCALISTLWGGVATKNSQLPGQTPITVSNSSAVRQWVDAPDGIHGAAFGMIIALIGAVIGGWTVFV